MVTFEAWGPRSRKTGEGWCIEEKEGGNSFNVMWDRDDRWRGVGYELGGGQVVIKPPWYWKKVGGEGDEQ